jgi:hypothetical protein
MTVCRCGYIPYSAWSWVHHCSVCPCATLAAQTPSFTERVREKRLTQNQDLIEGANPPPAPIPANDCRLLLYMLRGLSVGRELLRLQTLRPNALHNLPARRDATSRKHPSFRDSGPSENTAEASAGDSATQFYQGDSRWQVTGI